MSFPKVEALLEKLALEKTRTARFGSIEMIRGLMLQLISLVCRKYEADLLRFSAGQAQRGAAGAPACSARCATSRDHLAGEVTLADAAAAAFLSPNYLAHLLKKETGKTFTDLVTERRLEFAQEQLAHSSQRIASIAHASVLPTRPISRGASASASAKRPKRIATACAPRYPRYSLRPTAVQQRCIESSGKCVIASASMVFVRPKLDGWRKTR